MSAREWDASVYAHLDLPHLAWGRRVLDRLEVPDGGTVLDVGCGTGRDAVELRKRRPDVSIVALDGSQAMLDQARAALGDDDVRYVHADLEHPLPAGEVGQVDAVMSVACFHWISDHHALFESLARVMRPGARLTSDCGGHGNVANLEIAVGRVTGNLQRSFSFADSAATRQRLEAAGFDVEDVRLRPSPFRIDDPEIFETYLATVCLGGHLLGIPAHEHEAFVRDVAAAFDEPVLDYVRLEIDAVAT